MNLWQSGMERIYIPIICENCGNKVSVNGTINEGKIEFPVCPACHSELPPQLLVAEDRVAGKDTDLNHQINVIVGFRSDGEMQEATFKLGPYISIISAMQATTNAACIAFQDGDAAVIKLEYLRQELEDLPAEIKNQYIAYLQSCIDLVETKSDKAVDSE